MYIFFCILISLAIAFIILFLLAKLLILDLLADFIPGGNSPVIRVVIVLAVFSLSFWISYRQIKPAPLQDTYFTTKVELNKYAKIEKSPFGKETGLVPADTVLKAIDSRKVGSITWLECYMLESNKPSHIFVIIPEVIKHKNLKQDCNYYTYNEKSRTFNNYYQMIDSENKKILETNRNEFLSELKENQLNIYSSSDPILKESIKKTHFILRSNGYFGLYATHTDEFYYIEKSQKKVFNQLVSFREKKLNQETKSYF